MLIPRAIATTTFEPFSIAVVGVIVKRFETIARVPRTPKPCRTKGLPASEPLECTRARRDPARAGCPLTRPPFRALRAGRMAGLVGGG